MDFKYLFLSFLFIPSITLCQSVTINWGEEHKNIAKDKTGFFNFLTEEDGIYYFISSEQKSYKANTQSIHSFDEEMNLIETTTIAENEIYYHKKIYTQYNGNFGELLELNGKKYLLYEEYTKGKYDLYLSELLFDNGIVSLKDNLIVTTEHVRAKDVQLSENKEKLLVTLYRSHKTYANNVVEFHVFDKELNELWSKEETPKKNYTRSTSMVKTSYFSRIVQAYMKPFISDLGEVIFVYSRKDETIDKNMGVESDLFRLYKSYFVSYYDANGNLLVDDLAFPALELKQEKFGFKLAVTFQDKKVLFAADLLDPDQSKDADTGILRWTLNESGTYTDINRVPIENFSNAMNLASEPFISHLQFDYFTNGTPFLTTHIQDKKRSLLKDFGIMSIGSIFVTDELDVQEIGGESFIRVILNGEYQVNNQRIYAYINDEDKEQIIVQGYDDSGKMTFNQTVNYAHSKSNNIVNNTIRCEQTDENTFILVKESGLKRTLAKIIIE